VGEVSYGFAHFASLKNVRPDPESRAGGLGDTEFGAVLSGSGAELIAVVTFGL
jgi:hypothetical protein